MTCNRRIFPQEAKLILCTDPENPNVLCSAEVQQKNPCDLLTGTEENLRLNKDVDAESGLPPPTWSRGGGEMPHNHETSVPGLARCLAVQNHSFRVLISEVPGSKLRS